MYGPFSLASATAFNTSLLASTINGKWSDKGPFGSGSEAELNVHSLEVLVKTHS